LAQKEQAMMLLSVIIEYFDYDLIQSYYANLNPIIESFLQSEVSSLKSLSIVTVNKLAQVPKAVKVMKNYHTLIPLVLNAIDVNDDDIIMKGFETFNEFVEFKKIMKPYVPQIIEKALAISVD
jgi:hypothetical protein